MSQPGQVYLKRKRADDTPDILFLQGATSTASQVRYVKKRRSTNDAKKAAKNDGHVNYAGDGHVPRQQLPAKRREFHLQAVSTSVTGKRKDREDGVATFAEQDHKRSKQDATVLVHGDEYKDAAPAVRETTTAALKRPGKGSAIHSPKAKTVRPETEQERQQYAELAEYMQQAVAEEVQRETRPNAVALPRISAARSRELHRQRVASNLSKTSVQDVEMESDDEYVYETYVLAPNAEAGTMEVDGLMDHDNVGYLVISDEQQALWESYLEDEQEDKEGHTDDEDENAEDYYGADYPEDEVSSDDEFERNPYRYRGNNSDDEEWDEETGTHSDDEYDQMMNPFKYKGVRGLDMAMNGGDDSG